MSMSKKNFVFTLIAFHNGQGQEVRPRSNGRLLIVFLLLLLLLLFPRLCFKKRTVETIAHQSGLKKMNKEISIFFIFLKKYKHQWKWH